MTFRNVKINREMFTHEFEMLSLVRQADARAEYNAELPSRIFQSILEILTCAWIGGWVGWVILELASRWV
jgi:hypothetical protein